MAIFKDKGVVLREQAVNESDKRVTLLLKEHGKLTASVRGARKPKSKLAAATQTFTYGEYVLLEGNGFFSLTQAAVLESFHGLRKRYETYCRAMYFLELADGMLLRDMAAREPLRLLLRGLQALARGMPHEELAAAVFTYKFLQAEGYSPCMDFCAFCGEEADGPRLFFTADGLCCRNCVKTLRGRSIAIDGAASAAIRAVLAAEAENLFRMDAPEELRLALSKTSALFREENLDLRLKSLELI